MKDGEDTPDRTNGQNDRPESPADGASESSGEWQFSLDDIREREAEAAAAAEAEERRQEPIDPGNPSREGILFVLLGVVFTLFVISRLFL